MSNWHQRTPQKRSPGIRRAVWRRDSGLCQHTRVDTGLPCFAPGAVVDHIHNLADGGRDSAENCQVLCQWHSDKKTALESAAGRRKARQARSLPTSRGHRPLGSLE
ncbi:HNH endonuclease [Streptomyces sp. NPDC059917]|uniref:HNH endonuclease n=1 Tax=Streptomyces sp. NPDC059917 TaxID=3347002 RepID=UPI00365E8C77